jgi:hypothetical protein
MALSNMADGMNALAQGTNFGGPDGPDNARLEAWARFNQGHAHGILATMYDQAMILDETIDLESADLGPVPYTEVMERALEHLDDALTIAENNTFTIPGGEEGWVHGRELTNVDLQEWIHSLKARFLANVARTPDERQAVDWNQVTFHAERGVQAEGDLLIAEGHLHSNNVDAALPYINRTRVENGGLEPLPPGTSLEEAWANLIYESGMELQFSWTGQRHFNARGWGHLVCGTPLHYPIPGAELELLEIPVYTHGGTQGDYAAAPHCRDL